jgi:hypothetical protein
MLILALFALAQADAAERAEAWIHDGLASPPESVDRAALPPELQLAYDLALLAPRRTSGIEVPAEMRRAAGLRALEAWITGAPGADADAVPARLTGVLGGAGAARLAEALIGDDATPGEDALAALLKSVPLASAAGALLDVALDREVHPSVRGDLAVHLLITQGRPALAALSPVLTPDEDDRFLRQVFTAWRTLATEEDLPLLARLAREARGAGAQYALQLWARLERDPERRLEIYELALAAPGGYASLGLEALAEGGAHPGIAARLRGLLRAGTSSQRSLALRALARFDTHEAVLRAYRELDAPLSVAASGWWMPVLAQSPLPEAQQAAADWLAAGGIGSGATAQTVTRALAGSDAVLPMLGALLGAPNVPMREKLPLAMSNAARSADAMDFLRELARTGSGLDQQHAVRQLGAVAAPQDLAWLEVLARGHDAEPAVRALAFEMLVLHDVGAALLDDALAAPPPEWEALEALVRLAVARGSVEQRDRALALLRDDRVGDAETVGSLRNVAWTALADRGDPAGFELLAVDWIALLERLEADGRDGDEDWRDLYERLHAWPELEGLTRAARTLAPVIVARPTAPALAAWDPYRTTPEVLWAASALWSSVDAEQTVAWLDALDALPLTDANRIRVRGLRAARAAQPAVELESLRQLRSDPEALRRHPLYLAQAFTPEGARWTLFHDRLAEREVFSNARIQPPAEALARLQDLLDGYVEAEVLHHAARFARAETGGAAVALALAERGLALHPLQPDLAVVRAELLEGASRLPEARDAWDRVRRLTPPGHLQHEMARARLRALGD